MATANTAFNKTTSAPQTMTFKLTFTPDKDYYEEAYNELISVTKLRKWEPILAVFMTLFGIGLFYFDNRNILGVLPFFFILMGVYEFVKVFYNKKKWLKEREHSGVNGQPIENRIQ